MRLIKREISILLGILIALCLINEGKTVTPRLFPNFPIILGPSTYGFLTDRGVTLADINQDGKDELIVQISGPPLLYVFDYQGNLVAGFPDTASGRIYNPPGIGNFDSTSTPEIVYTTNVPTYIYIINQNGYTLPGFPIWKNVPYATTPALADLDRDGTLEIVFYSQRDKFIDVTDVLGNSLPGWPRTIQTNIFGFILGVPAIGDLDGDGDLEIVAFAFDKGFAWHHTGEYVSGWPRIPTDTLETFYWDLGIPALADLNADGKSEVIAVRELAKDRYTRYTKLEIYDGNGNVLKVFPQTMEGVPTIGPVLGDLNGDGTLEIVISTDYYVYVFTSEGELLPGWPIVNYGSSCQPLLADINADGLQEILYPPTSLGRPLLVYDINGNIVDESSIDLIGFNSLASGAFGDADGDDTLDLLIANEYGAGDTAGIYYYKYIYLLDMGVPLDKDKVDWPTFGHSNYRSNNFDVKQFTSVRENPKPSLPGSFSLHQNYPNPFNTSTQIEYNLAKKSEVYLAIYNLLGQKVRVLINTEQMPGSYKIFWDGKNESGKEVASGVYFYRLKTESYSEVKKMVLLK